VLYAWERVWHPTHPALVGNTPYRVALVELPQAGGVRVVGNVLGDPHDGLVIGTPLVAVFEDHDDADVPFTLVQWQVAPETRDGSTVRRSRSTRAAAEAGGAPPT
jgi:uncharacterized OB-fold protein